MVNPVRELRSSSNDHQLTPLEIRRLRSLSRQRRRLLTGLKSVAFSNGVKLKIGGLVSSLQGAQEEEKEFMKRIKKDYQPFLVPPETKEKISLILKLKPSFRKERIPQILFESRRNLLKMSTDRFKFQYDFGLKKGEASISDIAPLLSLGTILRNIYTWNFLNEGGLVFHACGLVKDGSAFVFVGPSESGKSTVAKVSGLAVLNEDIIFLKEKKKGFFSFTTPPWSSQIKTLNINTFFLLKALFILKKDKSNFLKKMTGKEAFSQIIAWPNLPEELIPWEKIFSRLQRLLEKVPVYELHFLPRASFWRCIENELYY